MRKNMILILVHFDVVCTVLHSTICTKTNKMHKILVIRLCFLLDAAHVSDYISPSSGATFYELYIAFGTCWYHTSGCCVAIATQYRHIPNAVYSLKVAPDDGLI